MLEERYRRMLTDWRESGLFATKSELLGKIRLGEDGSLELKEVRFANSAGGGKVRMRLFDDRLELYTPGMLPNTMTPEDLPYRQAARNEAITSLLARCPINDDKLAPHRQHIMDKRGEGVPIIPEQSRALAGRMPEYRLIGDNELLLTIYAANPKGSGE
jgi:hypothetical protein